MSKSYKNVSSVIPHAIKHTSNISFSNFLNCTWCDVDVPLPNATTSKSDTNSWIEKTNYYFTWVTKISENAKTCCATTLIVLRLTTRTKVSTYLNIFSFEDYYNVLQTNCYNYLSVKSFIITGTFRGPPMTWEITYMNQN